MKKHFFLGFFLLLGTCIFGQTLSSKPSKEKQTKTAKTVAKPLSEASKNQMVNTSRIQAKKAKPSNEIKIEKKKEYEK